MNRDTLMSKLFETMEVAKRSMHSRMQKQMADLPLSRPEWELLFTIQQRQPVGAKELSQILHVSPGAVSQLLEQLDNQGLVERTVDPQDRRRQSLHVAPAGEVLLKEMGKQRQAFMRDLMESMTDEELAVWLKIQQKLVERFGDPAPTTPTTTKGEK